MTGTAKVGAVVAVASASSVAAVFVPAAPWTAGLFEWLAHAGPLGVADLRGRVRRRRRSAWCRARS